MTSSQNIYECNEYQRQPEGVKYLFLSEGHIEIIKVVEYAYIGIKQNRLTYNFGFGTLKEDGTVQDDDISDNGDTYKVFNTVLSTVPDFLHNYPGAMIMVEGSDSSVAYEEACRPKCKKKCIAPACKNAHRRINIYKNFVNKHFGQLSKEYVFWGGLKDTDSQIVIENYTIPNKYDAVFFIKK
ncbi:MAG: hypothetical protein J7621_27600 [Niastella sp.]|nr:hypothetical protein [Niastella sp.]